MPAPEVIFNHELNQPGRSKVSNNKPKEICAGYLARANRKLRA